MEFVEFPKLARLSRECVITEKIDGTNAQIWITETEAHIVGAEPVAVFGSFNIYAGSRTKWLRVGRDGVKGEDNFGFAAWVHANAHELRHLGEGRHFGEWWGSGIQRGYGLQKGEKRFSLFNVARWHQIGTEPYVMASADPRQPAKVSAEAPPCCSVVPVLARVTFNTEVIKAELARLQNVGSFAAPGFMTPEGVVVFHTASGQMFKKTIEKDEEPKSFRQQAVAKVSAGSLPDSQTRGSRVENRESLDS